MGYIVKFKGKYSEFSDFIATKDEAHRMAKSHNWKVIKAEPIYTKMEKQAFHDSQKEYTDTGKY